MKKKRWVMDYTILYKDGHQDCHHYALDPGPVDHNICAGTINEALTEAHYRLFAFVRRSLTAKRYMIWNIGVWEGEAYIEIEEGPDET